MEDRRKEDRRKLYGKPFLAMLIGGLPEDRRRGERRAPAAQTGTLVRDEFRRSGDEDVEAAR